MIEEPILNRINKLEEARKNLLDAIDVIDDEIKLLMNEKGIYKPNYEPVLAYDIMGIPTITYATSQQDTLDKLLKDELSMLELKRMPMTLKE